MLNLKLNPTSVSTPLARGKTLEDKAFRELQKEIIVLNQHCGSGRWYSCSYLHLLLVALHIH